MSAKGKNVIVIGGGDTGNDCVGTCIRHGLQICHTAGNDAKGYRINERQTIRGRNGQESARQITVRRRRLLYSGMTHVFIRSTVKEFIKDKNGRLKAVKIVKLAWEKDPQTGRMNSKEVAGSEKIMDCELVLIAAGFLGAQKYVTDAFKVELSAKNQCEDRAR